MTASLGVEYAPGLENPGFTVEVISLDSSVEGKIDAYTAAVLYRYADAPDEQLTSVIRVDSANGTASMEIPSAGIVSDISRPERFGETLDRQWVLNVLTGQEATSSPG